MADASSASPPKESESTFRDWAYLPELVLVSIARCLVPALSPLVAFSSTCRRWRCSIRSSFFRSSTPPFLLTFPRRQLPLLLDPASGLPVLSSYSAPRIPSAARDPLLWLGSSHGHLIFIRPYLPPGRSRVAVFDPVTGHQKLSPFLPTDRHPYSYAALTSPPSSRRSVLLLFYSHDAFLYIRLGVGAPGWSTHHLHQSIHITRVISFKDDRVFGINNKADKLIEFCCAGEPHQEIHVKVSDLNWTGPGTGRVFDQLNIGPQLIECGGDLLLLLFVVAAGARSLDAIKVECCKLDFDSMEWVDADGLGDHALYVDFRGKCPVACYRPERWGGASGCVYLSGPGSDTFVQLTIGGAMVPYRTLLTSPYALESLLLMAARRGAEMWWPTPIWIYPSLLF